jgi:N-acetylneuraminate synthase
MQMVDASAAAGADAIKFQHHLPDEEMLPSIPTSQNMKEPLYEFLKRNALTLSQHIVLFDYCKSKGIQYLCTPFSLQAAIELEENFDLPVYKIGSGEMTDLPTLERVSRFGKPMIVSTGMSEVHEIQRTYEFLIERNVELILMNCTSAYPPSYADLHLGFIPVMEQLFPKAIIGHSDHTNEIYSSIVAIAFGAKLIEKHVTIDNNLEGPDAEVSLTFPQLATLIEVSRKISGALSSEKFIHESEREIIAWARRSIVYKSDFSSGHVLTESDIWGKRPGTGVPSSNYWSLIGRKLKRDVAYNTLLTMADLED